jgi:hypothetical protein
MEILQSTSKISSSMRRVDLRQGYQNLLVGINQFKLPREGHKGRETESIQSILPCPYLTQEDFMHSFKSYDSSDYGVRYKKIILRRKASRKGKR